MAPDSDRLQRLGGGALVLAGVLFLVRHVLEMTSGEPPSDGEAILAWVASRKTALSFVSETLFAATICLVPGVVALYRGLERAHPTKAVIGCGILAVSIPVLALLLVVHGRLVYPVYGLSVSTPAVAELVVAVYYGGLHAVLLLMGVATFVLSLAMQDAPYGRGVAYLGFVTGVLDVVGSYPDRIGPVSTLVCQIFFAAWFVAIGAKLLRSPPNA